MRKISTERIPYYALPYLINDDCSGLEDEDIKNADDFCKSFNAKGALIFDPKGEPYFTSCPAFGLATDVIDCDVYEA